LSSVGSLKLGWGGGQVFKHGVIVSGFRTQGNVVCKRVADLQKLLHVGNAQKKKTLRKRSKKT